MPRGSHPIFPGVTNETGEYFSRRGRARLDRAARWQEWAYLAVRIPPHEIVADVGLGWRPIVSGLHEKLLTLDANYRFFQVKEKFGQLSYYASFAKTVAEEGALLIACATAQAAATCEVCAAAALLRRRPALRTLCDTCFAADRAVGAERGEGYANSVLNRLLSGDPDYPEPDDIEDWLANLDR